MSFTPIAEGSEATPALWNTRFEQLDGNFVNVRSYGAVGDGVTDDTQAFEDAIAAAGGGTIGSGGVVRVPSGTYRVTGPISIPDNVSLIGDSMRGSRIRLASGTHMFDVGSFLTIARLRLDTENLTANDILRIASGKRDIRLDHLDMVAGNQYAIRFADGSAGANLTATNCIIANGGTTVPAMIQDTGNDVAAPRTFVGCTSSGSIIADIGGWDNFWFVACRIEGLVCTETSPVQAGVGAFVGCRFGDVSNPIVIRAVSLQFVGCNFSVPLELNNCESCTVNSSDFQEITETGTSENNNIYERRSSAITWTSTGVTQPALGNASSLAYYERNGKTVHFNGTVTMGSTTSFGNGTWYFALPEVPQPQFTFTGNALLTQASTSSRYFCPAQIVSNESGLRVFIANGGSSSLNSQTPFSWASGDRIGFDIVYQAR